MEEIREMNFSRKLSIEELKSYKGPIHCISHDEIILDPRRAAHRSELFSIPQHCIKGIA
jgi:hypothetical protein